MRKLLAKVEDGRFGRALAGFAAGWQWECRVRREGEVQGFVRYGGKEYLVAIVGRRARCSCADFVSRGLFCKHIAFVAMSELAAAAQARSEHRQLERRG
jgi:uncharacterized Zn finger protein